MKNQSLYLSKSYYQSFSHSKNFQISGTLFCSRKWLAKQKFKYLMVESENYNKNRKQSIEYNKIINFTKKIQIYIPEILFDIF